METNEIHTDESIALFQPVLWRKAVLINAMIALNFNLLNILFLHILASV